MWMLLHRHSYDKPEDKGDDLAPLPMLLNTESGVTFQPRARRGLSDGTWLRMCGIDQGKGGLWIADSFVSICERVGMAASLSTEDLRRWHT